MREKKPDNHRWNVSPGEAVEIQKKLRESISLSPLEKDIRTIAGADVSLNLYETTIYAGIIVLSYPGLEILDEATVVAETEFPYIPGLLSFREIPALMKCLEKLSVRPDLIMVDGQGIAHPRRLGIATHLGILSGIPTIGVAKSVLYGGHEKPRIPGEPVPLFDLKTREVIGAALVSKKRTTPLIISPGHRVSVPQAVEIAQTVIRKHKLPEPTRLAHELVNRARKAAGSGD